MEKQDYCVCDGMLETFLAYGTDCIFASPGSEWSPLWDAIARSSAEGRGPQFVNTRHEELAVSMAAGYYRQSGKLPVVVLHSTVGTLHASMALRAARHERIPMVVLSGDTAGFGEMAGPDPGQQWSVSLADVGGAAGMAASCVKRASAVTSREVLPGMIKDACRLALTPSFGPVFLSVPFEFMLGPCVTSDPRCAPPPLPAVAEASAIDELAIDLARAERPLLITTYAGRDPRAVAELVELASTLALPVVESRPVYLNFPWNHPLHQGFDTEELLQDADLVLLVATNRPWYPASKRPKGARVVLLDEDPGYELLPYWGYSVDRIITGNLNNSLKQLNAAVRGHVDSYSGGDERASRLARLHSMHSRQREQWRDEALAGEQQRPMTADWVALVLGASLPADAIITEEVITQKEALQRHLRRHLPGTYQSRVAGGLGVGLGNALGLKLASPESLVTLVVGDGSFNYGPVLAAFGCAQQFGVPILVVLMDNRGYASMKRAHLGYFPGGWSVRTGRFVGSEIEPTPDYAAIARAFGGYGERVEEPAQLREAIERAIERVQSGQLALLDVIMENRTV